MAVAASRIRSSTSPAIALDGRPFLRENIDLIGQEVVSASTFFGVRLTAVPCMKLHGGIIAGFLNRTVPFRSIVECISILFWRLQWPEVKAKTARPPAKTRPMASAPERALSRNRKR